MTVQTPFYIARKCYFKLANLLKLKLENVSFKNDFAINGIIFVRNRGEMIIGENFTGNSGLKYNPIGGDSLLSLVTHDVNAKITIGKNVGISNAAIYSWKEIIIGDNVIIGGGTRIWDSDFHSLNHKIRMSGDDNDIKTEPVVIGNYAFIGGGTIILKGVTIGENSVIAAGSVVTKSIPSNCIAGGNPCKVLKINH